jgi:hypothetical protein
MKMFGQNNILSFIWFDVIYDVAIGWGFPSLVIGLLFPPG